MRLQKLVYLAQVASLAWYDEALFEEDVLAYRDGPVVYSVFKEYQQQFRVVDATAGASGSLSPSAKGVVDFVCSVYGEQSGDELSAMTHREGPWVDIRAALGLTEGASSNAPIPKSSMRDYGRSSEEFMGQWWYWTPSWLAGECAVQEERREGLGGTFTSLEKLEQALDTK